MLRIGGGSLTMSFILTVTILQQIACYSFEELFPSLGVQSMSSAAVSSHFGTSLDWKTKSQERADHVMTAAQWINEPLNNMLKGQNPCDQSDVDHILR